MSSTEEAKPEAKVSEATTGSATPASSGSPAKDSGSPSKSSVTLPTGEDLDLATMSGGTTSEDDDEMVMDEEELEEDDDAEEKDIKEEKPDEEESAKDGILNEDEIKTEEAEMITVKADPAVASTSAGPSEVGPTKPVNDAKLVLALDGQEPTCRNLIIAAIHVMKSRKARPDTKRICNWIQRRYGNPYTSVSEELERMVQAGDLARVDYKGSVSFRINNPDGKVSKRKRKVGDKPLGRKPGKAASKKAAAAAKGATAKQEGNRRGEFVISLIMLT